MQKGFSMVVHSVMNSMEPPVSAEMSQIAKNLSRIDKEKRNNKSDIIVSLTLSLYFNHIIHKLINLRLFSFNGPKWYQNRPRGKQEREVFGKLTNYY